LPEAVRRVTRAPRAHLDAELAELELGGGGQIGRVRRQHTWRALEQEDACPTWVDRPELVRQGMPRDLGYGTSEFDTGWAAAHNDKRD
jgi:hypothetical protein